ncbi:MAG: LPS export ABC transporter periplasmic protein LptC [Siphonobacter sp.]
MKKYLKGGPAIFLLGVLIMACEEKQEVSNAVYTGPLSETENIHMIYTDSARKVVRMVTPLQLDQLNGDRIFPKELKLYFYDKAGVEHTWLRADSGRYIRTHNLYRVMGHVRIENRIKHELLETDELFWKPDEKKIYNNRPVKSTTPTGVTQGFGLVANQDFTKYGIGRVRNSQVEVKDLPN